MKPKISQTAGPKLSRSVSTLLVITHHPRKCSGTLAGGNIGRPSHSETTAFCGNTSYQESESKICASTKPGLAFCQPLRNNRQTHHILRLKNPQSSKKNTENQTERMGSFLSLAFFRSSSWYIKRRCHQPCLDAPPQSWSRRKRCHHRPPIKSSRSRAAGTHPGRFLATSERILRHDPHGRQGLRLIGAGVPLIPAETPSP